MDIHKITQIENIGVFVTVFILCFSAGFLKSSLTNIQRKQLKGIVILIIEALYAGMLGLFFSFGWYYFFPTQVLVLYCTSGLAIMSGAKTAESMLLSARKVLLLFLEIKNGT